MRRSKCREVLPWWGGVYRPLSARCQGAQRGCLSVDFAGDRIINLGDHARLAGEVIKLALMAAAASGRRPAAIIFHFISFRWPSERRWRHPRRENAPDRCPRVLKDKRRLERSVIEISLFSTRLAESVRSRRSSRNSRRIAGSLMNSFSLSSAAICYASCPAAYLMLERHTMPSEGLLINRKRLGALGVANGGRHFPPSLGCVRHHQCKIG